MTTLPDVPGLPKKGLPSMGVARQLRGVLAERFPPYCVVAGAGYGIDTAYGYCLSPFGLPYMGCYLGSHCLAA